MISASSHVPALLHEQRRAPRAAPTSASAHVAAVVGSEVGDRRRAVEDAAEQVGVGPGPRATVGQRDRRGREPVAAGVAAPPHPHVGQPRAASSAWSRVPQRPQHGSRRPWPHTSTSGGRLADRAGRLEVSAVTSSSRRGQQGRHLGVGDEVVDAGEAVRADAPVVDDAWQAVVVDVAGHDGHHRGARVGGRGLQRLDLADVLRPGERPLDEEQRVERRGAARPGRPPGAASTARTGSPRPASCHRDAHPDLRRSSAVVALDRHRRRQALRRG